MANNLNMIGINYLALGEPDKARTYLEKAQQAYENLGEQHGLAQVLNNLGIAWKDDGDFDQALRFYDRANRMAQEIGHQVLLGETWLNIGEIHRLRLDYEQALEGYQQSLKLAEKTEDANALSVCFLNIGEIHLLLGHDAQAEKWLTDCLALSREKGYQNLIQGSLRTLTDLYHRRGDDSRALASLEAWVKVRDQMLSEQKNKAIAELEARYRLAQKDKELALLKSDGDVQRLLLSTTRLRLYIAVLIALLAFSFLFWLGKRHRRLFAFWKKKTYIGPYQLGERLGGGGFGDVYKAFSIRDAGMPVALKLLREEYARDPLLRQRFLNEARVIDRLDHPHIVKVLERGENNDRLYLAMEFIDGKNLADIIKENPRLPLDFCVEVMKQLLDAVEALHRQGVLHRDLKPDNVMVQGGFSESPDIKLMDFDLARDVRMTPLTQTGELLGTLPYMPPERISGQICSEAGDLYSLGVLFYEMLTGEKPFPADTPVEVMKQVLDQEPLPAERLRQDIPEGLARLVSSLLNKEMAMRPGIGGIRKALAS
jgi:tetratricopeptide (TPR) repeat protein